MGTITTFFQPMTAKPTDYTHPRCDWIQTTGSIVTGGGAEIFADPAASDNFFLTSLNISFLNPTANALFSSYVGKQKIATYPTLGAATPAVYIHSFGHPGVGGVTTTTASVSIIGNGAQTATVQFFAAGWRKK